MRISARNQIRGTVKRVTRGAVNMEVILEVPGGGQIVSIITIQSGDALGLVEGMKAMAVIKASDVMIAVE